MKILGKLGVMFAAFAMVLSFGILSPSIAVSVTAASTNFLGNTLSLSDVQTTYDSTDVITAGDYTGVIIPSATVSGGTLNITAKNIAGQNYTSSVHQNVSYNEGNVNMFCPDKRLGTYVLTYSVTSDDGVVTSQDVTITFEGYIPSFQFAENPAANEIIPTRVNPGTTLRFAYPDIVLADEDNTVIPAADTHGTRGTTTITLLNPRSEECILSEVEGAMQYTVPSNDVIYGNYTVRYVYVSEDGYTISQSKTINVVSTDSFDQNEDVELYIQSFSPSTDSITLELGVETDLPVPTVVNTKDANNEIDVHTDITIQHLENGTWSEGETITNFKYTPTQAGQYRITYKVTDFYGHTYTRSLNIKTASLTSSSLQVKMVAPYSTDDVVNMKENFDDLENISYTVPTKIATDTDTAVTLPAIFGIGFGDYDDLTFTRSYTFNGATTYFSEPANEACTKIFDRAGTYSINYSVSYTSDTSIRVSLSTFRVVVEDNFTHTALPEVSISNAPNSVQKGDEFSVAIVANDYDEDRANIVDTNMELHVKYYYEGEEKTQARDAIIDENGNYVITVSNEATASSLYIFGTATNDFGNTGESELVQVFISDSSNDKTAPTLDRSSSTVSTLDATWGERVRGDVVEIPGISATDTESNVKLQVIISRDGVPTGTMFTKYATGKTASITDGEYSFALNEAGTYTITYVATDENGNMAVLAIEVNSNSDAQPSIRMNLEATAEYGQTINLYSGITTYLNGERVRYTPQIVTLPTKLDTETSSDYQDRVRTAVESILSTATESTLLIGIVGNPADILNNQSIVVSEDITVKAWAVNVSNTGTVNRYYDLNGSNEITITVSDTLAPVFGIVGGDANRTQPFYDQVPEGQETTLEELNKVVIPWFDASTINDNAAGYIGSGVNMSSLKIVVQYADADEPLATFTYEDADNENSVVATKDGKIIATYTLEDNEGNVAEKSITFEIGDNTPPQISLGNLDLTQSMRVGTPLTIDLTQITVTENEDSLDYTDVDISITCDGTAVDFTRASDAESITVNLETAGTYVISFSCKDTAGNTSDVITRTFTVTSDASTPVNSTTVWGTVLIVLALVILGVVIYFFVKPTKSKVSLDTSKKKSDENTSKTDNKDSK